MLNYNIRIDGERYPVIVTDHCVSRLYSRYIRIEKLLDILEWGAEPLLDLPMSAWNGGNYCVYDTQYDVSVPIKLEITPAGDFQIVAKTVFRGKSLYDEEGQPMIVLGE